MCVVCCVPSCMLSANAGPISGDGGGGGGGGGGGDGDGGGDASTKLACPMAPDPAQLAAGLDATDLKRLGASDAIIMKHLSPKFKK